MSDIEAAAERPQVIKFTPKSDVITLKREPSFKVACGHQTIILDEERRLLTCDECSECFEPFDYLWKMAQKQELKFS